MSSICFYVSHIEGLCNSESLVNRLSDDSSWRGSKSASQRLYLIGGESPNKKWKAQGRLFRMFAIYMLVFYSHEETGRLTVWQMESKTRYLKILLRNRVYRLHKFISFTDNCRENKTKLFFFYNNWANPRALIGQERWSLGVFRPWKWHNMSRSVGCFVFGFS